MSTMDHRRDKYRKKRTGGRFFALAASLLLLVSCLLTAIGFVPSLREKVTLALPFLEAGEREEAKSADGIPEPEETGSEVLPVDETGSMAESTTSQVQEIFVQRIDTTKQAPEALPTQPLTFTFAGDILFDDRYAIMASNLERNGHQADIVDSFDDALLSLMQSADVFMVNNEFPYSDGGSPLSGKKYTFRAKPEYAAQLEAIGVDIVALANNHMYDYGKEALLDTLSTLQNLSPSHDSSLYASRKGKTFFFGEAGKTADGQYTDRQSTDGKDTEESSGTRITGLPYVGAGRNIEEASAPVYFSNGYITVGIIAATQIERMTNPDTKGATETEPGVFRCLDYSKLVDKITQMKDECDLIIAYLHWGTESTSQIDEHQKKLAAAVAKAGAGLIIGDHPHVLQGISFVEGVPVIYSLGNYLFNSGAQDTCLFTASIDPLTGKLLALQFVPARQQNCRTFLLSEKDKERVISYMRTISDASIDDEGRIDVP